MKRTRIVALLFFGLILGGCATTTLDPQQRNAVRSLYVSPEVKVAPNVDFISGIGDLLAPGIGGAIGSIIDSAERDKDKSFTDFLKTSGIVVGNICRDQTIARLKADPFWGPRYRENGEYQLRIEIPYYSYFRKNALSDFFRPGILIRYELTGPSGEIIARGHASSGSFNDRLPEHTLEQIRENPALLKNAYAKAADEAIEEILKSFSP